MVTVCILGIIKAYLRKGLSAFFVKPSYKSEAILSGFRSLRCPPASSELQKYIDRDIHSDAEKHKDPYILSICKLLHSTHGQALCTLTFA
jgi:hypothetical protein